MAQNTEAAKKRVTEEKKVNSMMHKARKTKVFKKDVDRLAQLEAENAQLRAENEKLKKAPGA